MEQISATQIRQRSPLIKLITFSWLKKSTIVEVIAILFIILFLYTGISKLMEFAVFKEQISESPILKPFASIIVFGLPVTEFIVSALLFIPRYRKTGFYAALILMIMFTIYIIGLLLFSKELPCSCGGVIDLLSWKGHVVFNSAFIALAITAIRLKRQL